MSEINKDESLRSVVRQLSLDTCVTLIRRVGAAMLLGAVGYGVYFGGVFVASFVEGSVSTSDASWAWGGILAFALAASEMFVVEAWLLNKSLLRRLIVSGGITILSLLIAGPLCMFAGLELRRFRSALFLPRAGMGLTVFVVLTLMFRRGLRLLSRTQQI